MKNETIKKTQPEAKEVCGNCENVGIFKGDRYTCKDGIEVIADEDTCELWTIQPTQAEGEDVKEWLKAKEQELINAVGEKSWNENKVYFVNEVESFIEQYNSDKLSQFKKVIKEKIEVLEKEPQYTSEDDVSKAVNTLEINVLSELLKEIDS